MQGTTVKTGRGWNWLLVHLGFIWRIASQCMVLVPGWFPGLSSREPNGEGHFSTSATAVGDVAETQVCERERTRGLASGCFLSRRHWGRFGQMDPVGYVVSFLEGNARKWLISSWGPEASGRSASWHEFRTVLKEAFSECHSDEKSCVRLFRTKQIASCETSAHNLFHPNSSELLQDGPLEEYISKLMGACLSARGADDLARTMLFIEGLSSTEIRKEVRHEHPQTLEDAIRTARTARVSLNDSRQDADGGIATMRSQRVTGEVSHSERQQLFRQGRCFYCRKPGHIAANCPIKGHRAGRRTAEMPKQELSNKESPNEHNQVTTGAQSLVEIGVLRISKEKVGGMENSLLLAKVRFNGRETRGLIVLCYAQFRFWTVNG